MARHPFQICHALLKNLFQNFRRALTHVPPTVFNHQYYNMQTNFLHRFIQIIMQPEIFKFLVPLSSKLFNLPSYNHIDVFKNQPKLILVWYFVINKYFIWTGRRINQFISSPKVHQGLWGLLQIRII